MVGILQWTVSIGRIDLCYAVSSLSRFCVSLREEKLLQVFRIFGYLKKYPNKAIGVVDRESIINKKLLEDMTMNYGF